MNTLDGGTDGGNSRLERLEELAAFADRRQDELHAALLDLAARLGALSARVVELEDRVRAAESGAESSQTERPGDDEDDLGGAG